GLPCCPLFFGDTAPPQHDSLCLHDALPISRAVWARWSGVQRLPGIIARRRDRKSTRLNSSHGYISYAVFCLKKKKMHRFVEYSTENIINKKNEEIQEEII